MQRNQPYKRSVFRSLVMITQFGITMLVPMAMMFGAGYLADRLLGTNFCVIIGFFIGALAGFRNIYILARSIFDAKDEHNQ